MYPAMSDEDISRVIRQIKGETEEIDDTNESDDVPAGVAAAREEVAE